MSSGNKPLIIVYFILNEYINDLFFTLELLIYFWAFGWNL